MLSVRTILPLVLTAFVALSVGGVVGQARVSAAQPGQTLEGSWITDVTPDDPNRPRNITFWTFTADGSVISSNRFHPTRGPAHGAWLQTGEREFAVTFLRLIFDEQGEFIGTQKLRGQITLNETGDEFTSRSVSEFRDAADNFLEQGAPTTGRAQRIKVEAMP